MMLTLSAVVVLRYGFNIGIIAMQELVSYLHASVFMLGTAYALQQDSHVRVDIFYRNFSPRVKAWVNCVGGIIFLMPLCGYFLMSSWDFVVLSWTVKETSAEPGGLPAVFLFKSLIPLMAIMLSLQALAEIIRQGLFLVTGQEEPKS
ncbi:MAG: TRAP-type mannitol/chloroaromatic compound transport system permease small subunit [Pseudohongiellaceae bacterium]|jgi:TRAP-type mannitol/chloroaromatic compound transport system permease small subunit